MNGKAALWFDHCAPYSGHIVEFLITSMWDQFLALWHGLAGLTNAQLP